MKKKLLILSGILLPFVCFGTMQELIDGDHVGVKSTDKVGFFGKTPVVRRANTESAWTALQNIGIIATGGSDPLLAPTFTGDLTMANGKNIIVGTSTGTKIGTATSQKLGFFNATPIVQEANMVSLEQVLSDLGFRASGTSAPLSIGALTSTSIISPVITTGLTASGSAANDFSASTGTFLTSTGANTISGATTMAATKSLTLAAGTATAGQAPLYFGTSGTLLTVAAAGAIENDGISSYVTNETSSGRGLVPVRQFFMLTSDGGTISTIGNFFGANSNPTLVSGGYYEIEAVMYFTNSADTNTVTWTLVNSASPTAQNIYFEMSPAAGIVAPPGTATALVGQFLADSTGTKAWNSGALGSAANYYSRVRIWLHNGTGTSLKLQMTKNTGGTATPKAGSWWTCTRLPASNVGSFSP